jgi:hypothetical protein
MFFNKKRKSEVRWKYHALIVQFWVTKKLQIKLSLNIIIISNNLMPYHVFNIRKKKWGKMKILCTYGTILNYQEIKN